MSWQPTAKGVEHVLDSREITAGLPAQRDDEPPSLRRDIADEILDHLQAGLRRELLVRGGDESSAWKRVIERFGDPRLVARRLWFQAMWSKIMTQRVVVISALVSMTLSVVLTAMVGTMIQGQQQTNAALLEQMSKLVLQKPSPIPERDARWNNLKIKVTYGAKDGPAAQGLAVIVSKLPDIGEVIAEENGTSAAAGNKSIRKKHEASTDSQGIVDCGFVSPGLYELKVDSKTGESFSSTLMIYPGRDHVEEVVAPNEPQLANVAFHLEGLPEDLDSRTYGLILSFKQFGGREIGGQKWTSSSWFPFKSTPFVLIVPGRGVWQAVIPPGDEQRDRWPSAIFFPQKHVAAKWRRLEQPYQFQIPAAQYSVCFDFVRVPLEMTPDDPAWNRNMLHDPIDTKVEWKKGMVASVMDPRVITLVAAAGEVNNWTVKIPQALLNAWERRVIASPDKISPSPTTSSGFRRFGPSDAGSDLANALSRVPSLLQERHNPDFASRIQLTSRQKSELDQLWSRKRPMLREVTSIASNPESIARIKEGLREIEKEALEILTVEQQQIWEKRSVELDQQLINADVAAITKAEWDADGTIVRLRQDVFLMRAKLTDEQTQKLKEIESQLDAERRKFVEATLQSPQDENRKAWLTKFEELDKQFAKCLTDEQKAALNPSFAPARSVPATRAPR